MSDYLPQEILVEILHRLPSKSLVKCTSVCKTWRSLIINATFISDHLQRDADHFLLIQNCNEREHPNPSLAPVRYSLRYDDDQLSEFSTLDLPRGFESEFSVVGICNGLLCITNGAECYNLILCNPCIRRYLSLPKPTAYGNFHIACVGFGFDAGSNDYKVVRIVSMVDDKTYGICSPQVELYSLSTGFWKNLTAVAPICTVYSMGRDAPHAFINGVIHWGAKRKLKDGWFHFILSFDFKDEVFGEVMLPDSLARTSTHVTVIGGGESLTVYQVTRSPSYCNIWVMKEYGVVESWNKLFTFNLRTFYLEAPSLGITLPGVTDAPTAVCLRKSGKVLLLMDETGIACLYSLDIEGEKLMDLRIGGRGYTWYVYVGYYAESLVLLDKASVLVSY